MKKLLGMMLISITMITSGCGVGPKTDEPMLTPQGCPNTVQRDRVEFDIKLVQKLPQNLGIIFNGEIVASTCGLVPPTQVRGYFTQINQRSLEFRVESTDPNQETISFAVVSFNSCEDQANYQEVVAVDDLKIQYKEFNISANQPACGVYKKAEVQIFE